jgi:hypothetical protein
MVHFTVTFLQLPGVPEEQPQVTKASLQVDIILFQVLSKTLTNQFITEVNSFMQLYGLKNRKLKLVLKTYASK